MVVTGVMKKNIAATLFLCCLLVSGRVYSQAPRYLYDSLYLADPSAHVFNGKIYIYPSHDIKTNKTGLNGDHFDMKDFHVLSMDNINEEVRDHGVALSIKDVPWGGRQLWAPDCVSKNGKYYLYFPLKDKNDIFKIGVAISDKPEGPFKAEANPMMGSYSIDPAVYADTDGEYYMYWGGLSGGQLQHYRDNKVIECGTEPDKDSIALCPKVAKLSTDMLQFAEAPRDVILLDENGNPLKTRDKQRRFFEGAWVHKYKGKYYFSYSTGTTHQLCYAIGDNPYGPFTYKGIILTPVAGWTTHLSIIEFNKKWYLFYHDSKQSGKNSLRNLKIRELKYNPDGTIQTMNGLE
jgi:Beta-xylosidase